jgi:hypothetical protein
MTSILLTDFISNMMCLLNPNLNGLHIYQMFSQDKLFVVSILIG